MRRLFPVTDQTAAETDREWELEELADAYAYPQDAGESPQDTGVRPQDLAASGVRPQDVVAGGEPGGPAARAWLRANMVATLDGAAQHDGRSQPISTATDMRIFGTLRGLADVVVVGAETVRLEGYRPARARDAFARRRAAAGQSAVPAIAVVSASLELDFSLPLFASPLVPTLVVTGAAAPADRVAAAEKAGAVVVFAGEGAGADPARVVAALAERGLTRQLTEGGPRMLGQFVAAGVLDELCLTVSPMLVAGDAQRIAGGPAMAVPERFGLAGVLEEAGFLYTRYRRT
ncbi:pyrimidine reductase family protein [Actinomycetota bacterium Odt1-20B]